MILNQLLNQQNRKKDDPKAKSNDTNDKEKDKEKEKDKDKPTQETPKEDTKIT